MVEEIGVDGAKHRLQVTKIKTKKTKPYRAHLVMSMMIDIGFFFMVRLDLLLYQENLSIFPRDMCLLRMTRYSQLFVRCHEKYDHIMLH